MSQKLRAWVSVNWALKAHLINFTIVSPKTKGIKIEQQKRTLFMKKNGNILSPPGGVLDISLDVEVRRGPSYPDPV